MLAVRADRHLLRRQESVQSVAAALMCLDESQAVGLLITAEDGQAMIALADGVEVFLVGAECQSDNAADTFYSFAIIMGGVNLLVVRAKGYEITGIVDRKSVV